jgi:hypothetical protein
VSDALTELGHVIDQGYLCSRALARDPWLDALRSRAEFRDLLQRAVTLEREAASAFVQSGGDPLLGTNTIALREASDSSSNNAR